MSEEETQPTTIEQADAIIAQGDSPLGPGQIQVNIDNIRKTKVHICMPCYGGMLTESTFMSYIKWSNVCRQLGIDWTMETLTNESLISRARNTLVARFLNNPESTHLMFVDADIGWEPWNLLALLDRDVDVIGGLYPMKTLPIKWVVNGFEGAEEGENGLHEVSKTGTGFMLVKRHVFDKLNNHKKVIPFNNDIGLDKSLDKHLRTYYDTDVRDNRYYSEDWTFCENWRDMGGKVWVDKRVLLQHTGTYVFDHNAQGPLYDALKAMDPEIIAINEAKAAELAKPIPEDVVAKVIKKSAKAKKQKK